MKHRFAGIAVLLASLLVTLPALAQRTGDYHGFWHPGFGWGHMVFGGLMMLIFWGAVIALVVLLVRWLGSGEGGPVAGTRRPKPLEILQERYARGEIDREEYEQRKQDLLK